MEVITMESDAFKQILRQLEEIKLGLDKKAKQSPLSNSWLDNNEVCALLKISKRTLQSYRDEGDIPFSQIGAKIYYQASDIEAFLKKHYKKSFR